MSGPIPETPADFHEANGFPDRLPNGQVEAMLGGLSCLEEQSWLIWKACFQITHPLGPNKDLVPVGTRFYDLCKAEAWLEAAMLLLPENRAIRMHRYLGKKSGWVSISDPSFDQWQAEEPPDPLELGKLQTFMTNRNPTHLFCAAKLLECAVLMAAIKYTASQTT